MKWLLLTGFCVLTLGCNRSSDSGAPDVTGGDMTPNRTTTTEHSTTNSVATTNPGNSAPTASEPADRTNTRVNVRDRDGTTMTPMDQGEKKGDIEITANIRRRITATTMSVDADNVKIITQDGKVTLRGPVKTAEEREKIQEIASAVAGAGNVNNRLETER